MIIEILDLIYLLLIFLNFILVLLISKVDFERRYIFWCTAFAFILLIRELLWKDITYIPSGVMFLFSFFLILIPYIKTLRKIFIFIALFLLFLLLFSSYKYASLLIFDYNFSFLQKIAISGSLFLDSLIIFLLLLNSFVYFGGEYQIPWVFITIGFIFKFLGDFGYDVNSFWLIFIGLGFLKYLIIQKG